MTGARVSDEAWAEAAQQVESHLRMNLEIVDGQGKFLGEGRDLAELTARFAEASQAALAVPQTAKSQQPVEPKVFAAVAEKTQQKIAGLSMTVYPALVEEARHGQGRTVLDPGRSRVPASPCPAALARCSNWPSRRSSCAASCRA